MRLNPAWEFWLWTDDDNRQIVAEHYPFFLNDFDGYNQKMKQIDAVRFFYLHRHGGIYMDLDFTCLRPFEDIGLAPREAIFSHQYNAAMINASLGKQAPGVAGTIANNIIMAPAGHPFLAYSMRKLHSSMNRSLLHATGPNFLSKVIYEYRDNVRAASNPRGLVDAHVTVHHMPKVYATGYRGRNKCGTGLSSELEHCRNTTSAVLATFWTMTWKYVPPPPPPLPPPSSVAVERRESAVSVREPGSYRSWL